MALKSTLGSGEVAWSLALYRVNSIISTAQSRLVVKDGAAPGWRRFIDQVAVPAVLTERHMSTSGGFGFGSPKSSDCGLVVSGVMSGEVCGVW